MKPYNQNKNSFTLGVYERPEPLSSPPASFTQAELVPKTEDDHNDSDLTYNSSQPALGSQPETNSRPLNLKKQQRKEKNLSGALRKRLHRLKAEGVGHEEAYKLCLEYREQAKERGTTTDPAKERSSCKRARSEDGLPKDHASKTARISGDSSNGANKSTNIESMAGPSTAPMESDTGTFKDALTAVRVGIRNRTPMSDEQLGELKHGILQAMINDPGNDKYPILKGCTFRSGWLQIDVGDVCSREWLKKRLGGIKPWPEAELSLMRDSELYKARVGAFYFPFSEVKTSKDALRLLEIQNGLRTSLWKVLSVVDEKDGSTVAVSIDNESVGILQRLDFRPQVGFKKILVRVRGENFPETHGKQ